jgi:hypothetical protein
MNIISESKQRLLTHLIGFIFFSVLLAMSIMFFRERMLQNDNVFYLFKLIQGERYNIEHGRSCSVLSQFLPLIALKSGYTIKTVTILYSASFILLIYLFFLLIVEVFRDYNTGLALMVSIILVMRYIFYLPVAEFYQGLLVTLALWAYLNRYHDSTRKWSWFIFPVLCIISTMFFHLLNFIIVGFIIMLFPVVYNSVIKRFYILLVVLIVVTLYKYNSLGQTSYEMWRIPSMEEVINRIPKLTESHAYIYISDFIAHHIPLIVGIILLILFCLRNRRFLLLAYSISFAIAFMTFLYLTLPFMDSPYMYENYLCGLGVIIVLPIFICLKNSSFTTRILTAVFLFSVSIYTIFQAHYIIRERINYISHLCNYGKSFPEKKYLISIDNYPWKFAWATFTLPFETLMYQSVEDPGNSVTYFITPEINKYDSMIQDPSFFLGPEWDVFQFNWPDTKLKKKFFDLPDKGYRKLSTEQDKNFDETVFTKENVSISLPQTTYKSLADSFIVVPLKINNRSGKLIHSVRRGENHVDIAYHIYNEKGENILWDGLRTPLDVDVINEFTQGVVILNPKEKGTYTVVVDFVTEGKRWWGLNCEFIFINK